MQKNDLKAVYVAANLLSVGLYYGKYEGEEKKFN